MKRRQAALAAALVLVISACGGAVNSVSNVCADYFEEMMDIVSDAATIMELGAQTLTDEVEGKWTSTEIDNLYRAWSREFSDFEQRLVALGDAPEALAESASEFQASLGVFSDAYARLVSSLDGVDLLKEAIGHSTAFSEGLDGCN